jgi:hypothetical protein
MLDVRCLQSAFGGFDVHQFLFRFDRLSFLAGGGAEPETNHPVIFD